MGNVLSVHSEIFIKESWQNDFPVSKLISQILDLQFGRSYNGYPIIAKEYWPNRSIQLSFTSKYQPQSLIEFSELNRDKIKKIFARTFDETGDYDNIIELPAENFEFDTQKRKCRYQFDELQFKYRSNNLFESIAINGLFNSCSNLINQENRDIVNDPIEYLDNLKTYSLLEIESDYDQGINEILLNSSEIIFKHKGLTVHRRIKTEEYINLKYKSSPSKFMADKYNNGYYDIYSSGWMNCGDINYQEFVNNNKSAT